MEANILPNSMPEDCDGDIETNFYDNILVNNRKSSVASSAANNITIIDMDDLDDRPDNMGSIRSVKQHDVVVTRSDDGVSKGEEAAMLISRTVNEHIEDFFGSTTLHGIRYVANSGFNKLRRYVKWFPVVIIKDINDN